MTIQELYDLAAEEGKLNNEIVNQDGSLISPIFTKKNTILIEETKANTMNSFINFFNKQTANQIPNGNKVFALLLFKKLELPDIDNEWINVFNQYYTDGKLALNDYINFTYPTEDTSTTKYILVDAMSIPELLNKINEINQTIK